MIFSFTSTVQWYETLLLINWDNDAEDQYFEIKQLAGELGIRLERKSKKYRHNLWD